MVCHTLSKKYHKVKCAVVVLLVVVFIFEGKGGESGGGALTNRGGNAHCVGVLRQNNAKPAITRVANNVN